MDKIQESILFPLIVIPFLLMCLRRFTHFFNLEWDKAHITSYEKFKHKIVDTLIITLIIIMTQLSIIITDNSSSYYKIYKNHIDKMSDSALLIFSFFLIFFSVYMLIDIFYKNILSTNKIQIKQQNKYFSSTRGNDDSLHITISTNPKQFKKYGKTYLDENIIEYSISKEPSKVNKWIEYKVNEKSQNKTYKINTSLKFTFHLLLAFVIVACYIFFAMFLCNENFEPKEFYIFYFPFLFFATFVVLELSSGIYIPLASRFLRRDFFKKKQ